jgi:hypothetical protein
MICLALGNFGAACLICFLALILVLWRHLFHINSPKNLELSWDKSFNNKQLEKCVSWYCSTEQSSVDSDTAVVWCTRTAVMRSTNEAVCFISTRFRLVCKNELSSFVNTFVSITVCCYSGGYDVYPHCCELRLAVQLLFEGYSSFTALPVATSATVTKLRLVRSIRGTFRIFLWSVQK